MVKQGIRTGALAALLAFSGAAAAQDGGSVSGTVTTKEKIRAKRIGMDADPKCAGMHSDTVRAENAIIDDAGNVQWAFVYVKAGAKGKFEAPKEPVVIDQSGCMYKPHVFGILVGQELLIRNSDDLLHNIHAFPEVNKEFNFGQPRKGMEEKKTFSSPEMGLKFKCDVHPWMSAVAHVMEHPFFSVTDEKGKYAIKGLPAGDYEVEVWQESLKSVSQALKVGAGEAKTADFELKEKK